MATVSKYHGVAAPGAFYGYQPLVIKAACTGGFLASTGGDGATAVTEKGYDKAVKAVQQYGSIVWLGAQDDDSFCCIVDGATMNRAAGPTTAGDLGALDDAITAVRDGANAVTITTSSALNGAGTFTFA